MYSLPAISLWLLASLSSIIAPTLALPSSPGSTDASSISTVFQFDRNGTWFENIAVRPNGEILATRLDVPEVWLINPANNNAKEAGTQLYSFPRATGLLGITPIDKDVYAVVTGNFSVPTTTTTPGSYVIWSLDLSGKGQPVAKVLSQLPDAEFLNGIVPFGKNLLLVTDSAKGVIWRVDRTTGEYSQALTDPTMLPASGQPTAVGVNGINVLGNYVYYTSTTQMLFARIPVDNKASATGPAEIIASGFTPDDFMLTRDGTAYITTNPQNGLLKVDRHGRVQLVAGNEFKITVGGSTGVASSKNGSVLYVTTSGGQVSPILCKTIEPAKVVAIHV